MPLTLPTELILEIISYLQHDDVSQICLALTCRQFYLDIIPQVRKEHAEHVRDVLIPSHVLRAYQSDKAHTVGWGFSFDPVDEPTKLNGDNGEAFQGTFRRIKLLALPNGGKGIRSLRSLFVSAPALDHIVLRVPSSCEHKALVRTLSLCALRPSTHLTVSMDPVHQRRAVTPVLGRTPSFKDPQTFRFPKSLVPELLQRLRRDGSHALTQEPRISKLSISDDVIFFFEIYPTLIQLINSAPLEYLFIARPPIHNPMSSLNRTHWSTILSSISTQAQHIALKNLPLDSDDLLLFLHRHPNIIHLALELPKTCRISVLSTYDGAPLLPKLTTLEGDTQTVLAFLVACSSHVHLPVLRHLVLKQSFQFIYAREDNEPHPFNAIFSYITSHKMKCESIQVASLTNSGLISWIVSPDSNSLSALGWEAPRRFTSVTKLVFMDGGFDIPEMVRGDMMDWIDEHCPSMVKQILRAEESEKSLARLGRMTLNDVDMGTSASTNTKTHTDTATLPETQAAQQRDAKIVERFLWHVCPDLQVIELRDVRDEAIVEVIHRKPRAGLLV